MNTNHILCLESALAGFGPVTPHKNLNSGLGLALALSKILFQRVVLLDCA